MNSCIFVGLSNNVKQSSIQQSHENATVIGFEKITFNKLNNYLDIWAGTPEKRKNELENAFKSKTNCIWAYKGGSGIIHFIKKVDFKFLKKNPKLFLGYSDLTPLLNRIYEKTKLIALHGPIGVKPMDEESLKYLKKALKMENYSIPFKSYIIYKNNPKKIKKIIKGGNLAMISWSLGSSFQINLKNKIVFFEDIGTNDAIAYNRLIQLKLSGSLKPKAILFGYLQNIKKMSEFIQSVQELFPNIPIIYNLPIGHKQPNITIPIGSVCEIDFNTKKINFIFKNKHKSYRCEL